MCVADGSVRSTENGEGFISIVRPHDHSDPIRSEMRSHAGSVVVVLDEGFDVSGSECALCTFCVEHVFERAKDDQLRSLRPHVYAGRTLPTQRLRGRRGIRDTLLYR